MGLKFLDHLRHEWGGFDDFLGEEFLLQRFIFNLHNFQPRRIDLFGSTLYLQQGLLAVILTEAFILSD